MFIPAYDGVDHINVYSKGKTELGRQLSNFAHTPFEIEPYGRFESVEGFWYWLSTGRQHEELRELWGYKAKLEGRLIKASYGEVPYPFFSEEIKEALKCKVEQHQDIQETLTNSSLPLAHYYVVKDPTTGVEWPKYLPQYDWMIHHLEELRNEAHKTISSRMG